MRDDPTKDHPPSSRPARRPTGKKPGPARKKFAPLSGDARQPAPAGPPGDAAAAPQRIAKVIARAGACSRRDAEVWIGEGRVALNGAVLTNPAINVTDSDEITIDGAPLAARGKTRLFLFHKPRGLVTTERDPEGRQTIFDYLREHWPDAPRLVSVGRLDINTEGLLLLTNDGGLARMLELPATGWVRRYRVRAKGETDQGALDQLRHGVTVEGVAYAEIEATLDRVQGANCWLTMGLREGKNREIKRVLEHLGLEVNRLIRLSFGPFQLGDIDEGALEEVKTRVLRDQLGPVLAEAAHVDFAEPAGDAGEAQARPARPGRLHVRDEEAGAGAREKPRARADREARAPSGHRPREFTPSAPPPPRAETRKKPAPGPRKHISALRGDAEHGGARKRTLRSETADRSGRTVSVERLVPVRPRGNRKDVRRDREEAPPASRNARRFEAERKPREGAPERPMRGPGRGAAPEARQRAPGPRWQESKGAPRGESRGAPKGERRESPGESRREGPRGERAQKPRGPYDAAKDRSRPELRRGKGAGPKRFDESFRAPKAPGARTEAGARGQKRFGAGPAKPGGPKSAARGFSGKSGFSGKDSRGPASDSRPRGAGPASGFRGKDKGPGGKGRPSGGPRGRPGGKPGGAPRGAPRGGSGGGPGKGRPRGTS